MRRGRTRRDTGAIAVVMAVVLVGLLVPLTAFGVTTYIKSDLGGELQRAADAGATAGAARIPLIDAGVIKDILDGVPLPDGTVLPGPTPTTLPSLMGKITTYAGLHGYCTPGTDCPLDIAAQTCEAALAQSGVDGLGGSYATSSDQPADLVHCTASFGDDPTVDNLISCLTGVPDALFGTLGTALPNNGASALLAPLGNLLGGLTSSLLQTNITKTLPDGLLGALLPSILTPRISVHAQWYERGPLDGLNPGDDGQPHLMSRDGTARRAFRNVIVVPTISVGPALPKTALQSVLGLLGDVTCAVLGIGCPTVDKPPVVASGATIDLNPPLGTYLGQLQNTLGSVNQAVFSQLGSLLPAACASIVPGLQSDLSDLLDPPSAGLAPSADQVIASAVANSEPVLVLQVPTQVTSPLLIPFLSFVPTCLSKLPSGTVVGIAQNVAAGSSPVGDVGSCTLAAPGMFRARLIS